MLTANRVPTGTDQQLSATHHTQMAQTVTPPIQKPSSAARRWTPGRRHPPCPRSDSQECHPDCRDNPPAAPRAGNGSSRRGRRRHLARRMRINDRHCSNLNADRGGGTHRRRTRGMLVVKVKNRGAPKCRDQRHSEHHSERHSERPRSSIKATAGTVAGKLHRPTIHDRPLPIGGMRGEYLRPWRPPARGPARATRRLAPEMHTTGRGRWGRLKHRQDALSRSDLIPTRGMR